MSEYKIIKFINPDNNEVKYLAVVQGCFQQIPHADCYSGYGHTVGHGIAGDSLTILSEKALQVAFEHLREEDYNFHDIEDCNMPFGIGETIYAHEDVSLFCTIFDNEELEEGVDYTLEQVIVEAYTYYNGSNQKTVILNGCYDGVDIETPYESIDAETEKQFNEISDNMDFDHKCGYWTRYRSDCGKWFIYDHHTQGSWERYSIEELVEEEYC